MLHLTRGLSGHVSPRSRPAVSAFGVRTAPLSSFPVRDDDRGSSEEVTPVAATARGFRHWLSREGSEAPTDFNRWKAVPASFLVQLSIGSVYSWSTFNAPLTTDIGVIAQSSQDWSLSAVVPVVSVCITTLGVVAALAGPWAERSGPRKVAAAAGLCWSTGLLLSSAAVATHSLPLLYLGYGLFGGAGCGLGYISNVSNLIKFFPDRRGLATGLALMAFGGGAMVAAPLNEYLFSRFKRLPEYLGPESAVETVVEHGRRFADVGGTMREVLVASASDVATLPGVAEGVYVLGTGSSGVGTAFLALATGYGVAMFSGAAGSRVPAPGWLPDGYTPPKEDTAMVTSANVHHNTALRTPQFYLLWTAVAGNAVAGLTVLSCAKTMMGDIFSSALPAIVTGGFAASYVAALSCGNMLGRIGWSVASDKLGRRNTYALFGVGIPLCLSIPYLTSMVATSTTALPLYLFCGSTILIVSTYGGMFSVLPAYLADVFGLKHVGAIHGRALTAWSAAALSGPILMTQLRQRSYDAAVQQLVGVVDDDAFAKKFGASKDALQSLVDANTVTIGRLLEVCPAGTPDPTPSLYDTTMYGMAGIMSVAFVANLAMRPVLCKFHLPAEEELSASTTGR